jgi:t-SNARE complex subunit (syntaxin)
VAEDDELELRLKALREELMRHVDAVKNDVENVHTDIEHRFDNIDSQIKSFRFWVVLLITILITVFGVLAAILANAANLI